MAKSPEWPMRLPDSPCILDPEAIAKQARKDLACRGYGTRIRALRMQVEKGFLA
jgi:hypothetical protein